MKNYFSNKMAIFIFAFPALFLFTIFVIFPIFPEILISFQKNDGFRNMGYIGFENYNNVFQDKTFWRANYNTIVIVILSTFVGLPISLIFALKNRFIGSESLSIVKANISEIGKPTNVDNITMTIVL